MPTSSPPVARSEVVGSEVQQAAGIEVISDGETRRPSWSSKASG
jgi:hypothetical protein